MKIVNTSDKEYEFTYDSMIFGPYAPGEIVDLPDDIARHAIRRSAVNDDAGQHVEYRVSPIGAVDRKRLREMAVIPCPYADIEGCKAVFKAKDDLRAHLETHWQAGAAQAAPPASKFQR